MNKGIKTRSCFDYEEIVETAYVGYDEGNYDSFAFVGDMNTIQAILCVLLNDYDMELSSVYIDTVEYDGMYQLFVDENELVTISPILEYSEDDIKQGYIITKGVGKWFIDSCTLVRFIRALENNDCNFETFEINDEDEDNSGVTFTITTQPELNETEFENMLDSLECVLKRFNGFF